MEKYKRVNELLNTQYKSDSEIDWCWISEYQNLSEKFIREFQNSVYWKNISIYQKLSESFIGEFRDKVQWSCISMYQKLSEKFIREFKDDVDWCWISEYQNLSETFIREFKDDVDWKRIGVYQDLSTSFIREFQDDLNWYWISKYQKLSETFIREFQDDLNWELISKSQKLSEAFIREFQDKVDMYSIEDSWHYKDVEFKKQQVIETDLYECHDDYFIAYKGIRSDRYSKFNFQYQYLVGQTYESWCDCSSDENSFGLSVWTEDKAREYCDELVVKCKIKYEDVGRVVHNGGKVRCFKIEVLD